MSVKKVLMAVVVLTGALGPAAQAQARHDGFWIGFGLGGGYDVESELGGGAGYFRLGGTPTEQLLIGGEVIAWAREESGVTLSRGNLTGTLMFYPSAEGGFFLKPGVGFASVTAAVTIGNVTRSVTDEGFGATLGAGYDIKLGRNFYLTPNVDVMIQTIGGQTQSLVLFTVGAMWH